MKVEELKEICKMYKIRRGKRKNDYVEIILHRAKNQNRDFSVQNKVNHYFKNSQQTDQPEIHNFYKNNFNLIDINDKAWYSVEECHPNHHWECKMLISIMRDVMLNCWTLFCQTKYMKFKAFRADLIKDLLKTHNTENIYNE